MATPPQISPDGHYWWDGHAWQPIQPPVQQPVAPVSAPSLAQAPAAEAPPSWLAVQPQAPAPQAPVYPEPAYQQPVYEQAPLPPPAWATPSPRSNRMWIYMTGLLMIALIAIGGVYGYNTLRSANDTANVQTTPSPIISDYERANRFLNVDLGPALVETDQALPAVQKNCTSSLPPPCKDALITLNNAMIDLGKAMQTYQNDIPVCIGREVDQFKNDWEGMEQGLSSAIAGFNSNNREQILEGLQRFGSLAQFITPDVNRINAAQKTCSQVLPPVVSN
jgi:hypothetical protein